MTILQSCNFCMLSSCYLFTLFQCSVLSKFVNKTADAGITALHMAALNGHFDCVQLLLDLNANVSAATFHYGTSMDLIGSLLFNLLTNVWLFSFFLENY